MSILNNMEANKSEPVAYRDKDGKIKPYAKGEEPVIWVRDYSDAKPNKDIRSGTSDEDSNPDRAPSVSSEVSGIGESYAQHPRLENNTRSLTDVVSPVSPVPEVRLPRKRRKDFMTDENTFLHIDEHAIKAPPVVKEDLHQLVAYLKSVANTSMEKVRAFYVWITHNINYDTSGYFGRAPLRPTDAESVLKTRLTTCKGYCNLFEVLCREVDIPVKTISGYAKAYNYKPGEDVTKDNHNAHAWNAVFLDGDWLLLDVTWGAGFLKAKEKQYVAKFNQAYFLTDPEVFLTDHFPCQITGYEIFENGPQWQLVDDFISKDEFCQLLNFDKQGKEWGIQPVTHTKTVITNVRFETDVVLQSTYVTVSDYIAYMYEEDRKIEQFTYTQMLTDTRVNVHITVPAIGVFSLQIFGRKKKDGIHADYQPIVKYILQCTEAYTSPIPYPSHHTVYGPVSDLAKYGVSDVGDTYRKAAEGEIILKIKPTRFVDIIPKLRFGDHNMDLKEYCFVDYSDCFNYMHVIIRLRYEGYFKLELLSQPDKSKNYRPFVAYLIKCSKACHDGVFPYANEYALKYKCCLLEPLYKHIQPKTEITFCVKSSGAVKMKCNDVLLTKIDHLTFEGRVRTPPEDCKFSLEGAAKDGVFHTLYTYDTITPLQY